MPNRFCNKFILGLVLVSSAVLTSPVYAALVNINTAGSTELQTLNGIGPTYAQRIIDYRATHGLFQKIDDIKNVSGIGDVTFSKIKDFITVGEVVTPPPTATSTATTTPVGNDSSPSGTSTAEAIATSVHYSAALLSSKTPESSANLSAGRARLGAVGTPLQFKAETNLSSNHTSVFEWNFGDGGESMGDTVSHAYSYPGEYVVVLNATLPDGHAVARTSVKVVEAELLITAADKDRIEIRNNSPYEINLFGRALWWQDKIFAFPKDTIIKASSSVIFPANLTQLTPQSIYEVTLLTVGDIEQPRLRGKVEEEKTKRISELKNEISLLQAKVATLPLPARAPVVLLEEAAPTSTSVTLEAPPRAQGAAAASSNWLITLKHFFLNHAK